MNCAAFSWCTSRVFSNYCYLCMYLFIYLFIWKHKHTYKHTYNSKHKHTDKAKKQKYKTFCLETPGIYRLCAARLFMLYKIHYGLVATPMPLDIKSHCITLHYIYMLSARPTTARTGPAIQVSTIMLKTKTVNVKSW